MASRSAWEFRNPTRIVFGSGSLRELPRFVAGRALIVTTAGATARGLTARVSALSGANPLVFDRVESNPALDAIESAVEAFRTAGVATIVGVGGGSALDSAKALSLCLATERLTIRDAIARGPSLDIKPLPVVAVPTTAGTGSEVTPFATIWDRAGKRKLSLTTARLFPDVALLDPELTLSLPWPATLSSGLDAFAQCLESIWNRNATPVTLAVALRGAAAVPAAMRVLKSDAASYEARRTMLEASLLSGLAISGTRTALSHSMSYAMTAHHGVPHGLACGITLPAVLAYNLAADDGRLREAGRTCGYDDPHTWVAAIVDFLKEMEAPEAFRRCVPDVRTLRAHASEMLTPGRADNNLRPADARAVDAVLAQTEAWLFTPQEG